MAPPVAGHPASAGLLDSPLRVAERAVEQQRGGGAADRVAQVVEDAAAVLDVGGGAGHQSLPLARLGHDVTIVDSSPAMLACAAARIAAEPGAVRARVRLVEGPGERVLGTPTRGDIVDGLSELLRTNGLRQEAWYGVWLFADWVAIPDDADAQAVAEVELQAAARDPYRGLSRVFHLVGRRG